MALLRRRLGARPVLLVVATGLALGFWVLDSCVDALVFHDRAFAKPSATPGRRRSGSAPP